MVSVSGKETRRSLTSKKRVLPLVIKFSNTLMGVRRNFERLDRDEPLGSHGNQVEF